MNQAEKRRRKNRILNLLLVVFAAIFIVSGIYLFRYYYASRQNKALVDDLKGLIDTEDEDEPGNTEGGGDPHPGTEEANPGKQGQGGSSYRPSAPSAKYVNVNDRLILKKFKALYEKNQEFIGWLTIDGTNVDYPVMYTPQNEEKYLRKNFEGEYALAGTLFLGDGSDPVRPTTNILIYGHNMKDGSMFADLLNYKDQDYYEDHKTIRFDTIYGTNSYEIIAAFPGQVLNVDEEGFRYYQFFDAETEEEFDSYVREVTARSSIKASAKAQFGDLLLTLSTCDSSGANEGKRFVVVARRVGN